MGTTFMERVTPYTDKLIACVCCGKKHTKRDPSTDPWNGRMNGYCDNCSENRCDAFPNECPNDVNLF